MAQSFSASPLRILVGFRAGGGVDMSARSIAPIPYRKLGYDVMRSFAPITQAMSSPFMNFAVAALRVNTASELVAYAKERPRQLNSASSGERRYGRIYA